MSKNLYIFTFDAHKVDSTAVHKAVKNSEHVNGWSHYLASSYLIFSNATAKELSQDLRRNIPKFRHIIYKVDPKKYYGFMPKKQWDWLDRNI